MLIQPIRAHISLGSGRSVPSSLQRFSIQDGIYISIWCVGSRQHSRGADAQEEQRMGAGL